MGTVLGLKDTRDRKADANCEANPHRYDLEDPKTHGSLILGAVWPHDTARPT